MDSGSWRVSIGSLIVFRVSFFVDDKKLPGALRDLAGVAAGHPEVQPVVNGEMKGGKVQAAGPGDNCALFMKYAKQHKLTRIAAPQLREFCKSIGASEASYSYLAGQLLKGGCIKKHGKAAKTYYTVSA